MALTVSEQQELAKLEAEIARLELQQQADGVEEPATEGKSLGRKAAGVVADIAIPAVAATAGQAVGAFPLFSLPTLGLSVPLFGGVSGTAAYAANELAQGRRPTLGGGAEAFISSAIPGAQLAGATTKALAKEGAKQITGSLVASQARKGIDEGEVITPTEAALTSLGVGGGVKLASKIGGKSVAAQKTMKEVYATRDDTLRLAQALGYTLDSVQSNPNWATRGIERISGGQSVLQLEAAKKNQLITNEIVRSEIGLPPNAELNDLVLANLKLDVAAPYRQLEQISPVAKKAMERLDKFRKDARDYWRDYSINGRVETKKQAEALQSQAESIEKSLEKIAVRNGNPTLVQEMRDARKRLAKIYVSESALNPNAQNVDASVLLKIREKNPDYLTDGLKAIADIAGIQGPVMKEFTRIPSVQSSQLARNVIAGSLGTFGYTTGGVPGALAGIAAGSVSDIPFRALAGSKTYQSAFGVPRYDELTTPNAAQSFLMQSGRQTGLNQSRPSR
jgi:hypothetical protein